MKALTRRELLRGLLRALAFGSLTIGGGVLAVRSLSSSREDCLNRGICGNCRAFDGCGLPQALSKKANSKSESRNPNSHRKIKIPNE